jgi:hypothetical protein
MTQPTELREKIEQIVEDGHRWGRSSRTVTDAIIALPELQQALALAEQVGRLAKVCKACGGKGKEMHRLYLKPDKGWYDEYVDCPTCRGSKVVPLEPGDVDIVKWVKAITTVLADEESGKGWGPDVTMVGVLLDALSGVRVKEGGK